MNSLYDSFIYLLNDNVKIFPNNVDFRIVDG